MKKGGSLVGFERKQRMEQYHCRASLLRIANSYEYYRSKNLEVYAKKRSRVGKSLKF